jgi:hypothetical protein
MHFDYVLANPKLALIRSVVSGSAIHQLEGQASICEASAASSIGGNDETAPVGLVRWHSK